LLARRFLRACRFIHCRHRDVVGTNGLFEKQNRPIGAKSSTLDATESRRP
jgi:hypothetical protein